MKVLDSYALVEIREGNKKFEHLLSGDFQIVDLTISEFYGLLYLRNGKETANKWIIKLRQMCVSASLETLIKAREFKIQNPKKDLSFIDCVGYIYAKDKGYVFVTGDKEFQNLPNVEYIKS